MRDGQWDWDTPLDDAFVRGASSREGSAAERVSRARRISSSHAHAQPWRAGTSPSRRYTALRPRMWRSLAAVLVVLGGTLYALTSLGGSLHGAAPAVLTADGSPLLPRPADARDVRILPAAVPPPGDGGFAVLAEHRGEPIRFDPCRPVHWVLRERGAPPDAVSLMTRAFAGLSAAAGLAFVHDGWTDEDWSEDRALVQDRYGERYAPVLVVWSDESETSGLAGDTAGFAGPRPAYPNGGGPRWVTGGVVLDGPQLVRPDVTPDARLAVVLHELAHLAGLDHVDDPTDTMHESFAPPGGYTAGALRGLAAVGAGGCR